MEDQIIKLPAVQLMTGLSRTTVYRLSAESKFPARVRLSDDGNAVGWRLSEIQSWIANRPRADDGPQVA